MLAKNAIEETNYHPDEFVSSLFLVPKKTGDLRPVINLKPLNEFVQKEHFKMESIDSAINMINKGDYLASLDLKDAYFSIPIAENHRKYLRFIWKQKRYQFCCLPFGLTSAPRIFTKVLKPVVSCLRDQGIRVVIYLDDILIIASSKSECLRHLAIAIKLLTSLGFTINEEKSCMVPTQRIQFLGFMLDSTTMQVVVPPDKCDKIVGRCKDLMKQKIVTVKQLASIVGMLKAVNHAVLPANLFCRRLQAAQISASAKDPDLLSKVTLLEPQLSELRTWVQCLNQWNGRHMIVPPIDFRVQTDSSKKGWGAYAVLVK